MKLVASADTTAAITLQDAKRHLRIVHTDDDAYINALCAAATEYAETKTHRQCVNRTFALYLDAFPAKIIVPRPPLSSVTSITYYDAAGSSQTLGTSVYTVVTQSEPGEIVEAYAQTWPNTYGIPNAVTVTYVAGYGATEASVPTSLQHAIRIMVAHWYANREPVVTGMTATTIPQSADALLASHMCHWIV